MYKVQRHTRCTPIQFPHGYLGQLWSAFQLSRLPTNSSTVILTPTRKPMSCLSGQAHTGYRLYLFMSWTTPRNQETNAMLIADRQTLAGLYPYMLWTTPGNQETKAMLIDDRHRLAGLYHYSPSRTYPPFAKKVI